MEFITLRLPRGAGLTCGATRLLVGYALRRRGLACWERMDVDAFTGGGETLLFARPEPAVTVRFADYALPVLQKYFAD